MSIIKSVASMLGLNASCIKVEYSEKSLKESSFMRESQAVWHIPSGFHVADLI